MLTAAVLSLMIAALARPAAAQDRPQGAIAGTVTDARTGTALSAVEVQVSGAEGSRNLAFTTASGAFRVEDLPAGGYTVIFRLPGWEERRESGVSVRPGETTTLQVGLTERAFNLNPITVTVSRTREKVLEAPAAVEVVTERDIREEPALSTAEHVRGVAGVDVITTGLQGHYVVARGFNNIFSGAMLTLTDNRIARVPSLRANISHLTPTTSLDLERIEVVLGPGSALYGPNAAHGVLHQITSSPIDDPGAAISLAGGLRHQGEGRAQVTGPGGDPVLLDSSDEGVFHGQARYAWRASDEFGIKVSGQYFQGQDFRFIDPEEFTQQQIAQGCQASGYNPLDPACQNFAQGLRPAVGAEDAALLRTSVDNVAAGRDNTLERWTADVRADWRPAPDVAFILAGGHTTALNSVDLTGLGAAQVVGWGYNYVQARALAGDLFAQVFINKSDNEESYLLRSGRPLVDRSELLVAQAQHRTALGETQRFTYGLDLLRTIPKTEGTINGQNEGDDDITELGGYVQSETALDPRWDLVLAARLDHHSRLEDLVFSPRAALVFRPEAEHSFRATYNRAFSTPTTLNLFLDISGGSVPLGGPLRYDIRAQGATEDGFTFQRTNGIPDFRSPFNVLIGRDPMAFTPTTTGNLWRLAVAAVTAGADTPEEQAAAALLASLPPPNGSQVRALALTLNPAAGPGEPPFLPAPGGLSGIGDVPALDPTIHNTFEVGYKGLLSQKILLSANAYYSIIDDFTSALRLFTPNAFLSGEDVAAYVAGFGVPPAQAAAIGQAVGSIPLGVLSPADVGGTEPALALTYQNLGQVELFGTDLSATVLLGDEWEAAVAFGFISDDEFDTGEEIVPLNAPTVKGALSLAWRNDDQGLTAAGQVRMQNGFPANSGVYAGEVAGYGVLDLMMGYDIPGAPGATVQLDVQNVLDNSYQTFVGAPELGRFALLRLIYTF